MADDGRESDESRPAAGPERSDPAEPTPPAKQASGRSAGQRGSGGAAGPAAEEPGASTEAFEPFTPTEALEPSDLTQPTEPLEPEDFTQPSESAGPAAPGTPPEPPRWSARAHVPPAGEDGVFIEEEEWVEPSRPGRSIALPVLVVICTVLLLGLVALATWLALRSRPSGHTPVPTVTATTTESTTAPPTTTPAPTETTTALPTTGPVVVNIPDLRGSDYDTAAAVLSELGLVPVRVDQTSAKVPADQVISTDPEAGTAAAPGLRVDVFVSVGSPEPTTTEPPSTGEPS